MKVLVANLGSTSFKYRLFDLPSEKQLARGGIDRIGQTGPAIASRKSNRRVAAQHREEMKTQRADHAEAVRICLEQLTNPKLGLPEVGCRSRGDRIQGGLRGEARAACGWSTKSC